jgi:hypothetical protein
VVLFITKPITLLVARVLNPLAEFNVVPEPAKVMVPVPVCINWQLKPMGKVGTVTVTVDAELIKNSLLLSVAAKLNEALLVASMTNPPAI